MADERTATDKTLTLDPSRSESRPADAPLARSQRAIEHVPTRFEVEATLGEGATAVVLAARDRVLGRRVALKVFDLAPDGAARLLREARAVASLDHPDVVRVYEVDVARGLLVMELLEGGTLHARLERARLTGDETIAVGRRLASALAAAHATGLLHRDVKPSNVLFDAQGRPRLADFGIAVAVGAASEGAGTRAYAAPEQMSGEASVASDVYGLGATLLAACTGRRPDARDGQDVASSVFRATKNRALASLLERMLQPEPGHRPASAREVHDALGATCPTGVARWGLAGLAFVLVALVIAGLASRSEGSAAALASARSALRRNDLEGAQAALARADPDAGETVALSVLLDWWHGTAPDALVEHIDHALTTDVPASDREVLTGLRLLGRHRIDDAADYFDALVARTDAGDAADAQIFPDLALYGAFEAHWHRGEGARAISLYDRIRANDADFALGIEHVLTHDLMVGQLDRVSAILASSDAVPTDERVLWNARLALTRGEPAAAIDPLRSALAQRPDSRTRDYARTLWALAEAARGDREAARLVAERCEGVTRPLLLHALGSLDPDAPLEETRRAIGAALTAHPTGSYVSVVTWIALELALDTRGDLAAALDAFERVRRDDVRTRMIDLWVAWRRGDVEHVRALGAGTSPEVTAVARALEIEAEGNDDASALAWQRAAEASNDGTFCAHSWLAAARANLRAGHREAAASACSAIGRLPTLSAVPLRMRCAQLGAP